MHATASPANKNIYTVVFASAVIGATLMAVLTGLWVLTAISIGLLFGFFLQKGDLCGASAFSEVLLMKEWRKIRGLWICIVVGMAGFAILSSAGWVTLAPKPLIWANYLIGGVLFGVGMVFAGGCISGCLYKAGTGNLNSMVALPGIALGVAAVEYGPLNPLHKYLQTFIISSETGGPVTLPTLTGLSYPVLAAFFLAATLAAAVYMKRKPALAADALPVYQRIFTRSWKPWAAGLMIGILGSAAYLSSVPSGRNYPLGVTHGVLFAQLLITEQNLTPVYQKSPVPTVSTVSAAVAAPAKEVAPPPAGKKYSVWLIALVISLVIGSWISAKLSGTARLLPRPPEQVITAFFGGLLLGVGAAIATGCVIGNIISGWALMSVGNILFGITVVLANWAITWFYLMGGSLRS